MWRRSHRSHRPPDALFILDVAILPDWQGRGIGAKMLREICEAARGAGVATRLDVFHSNGAALRLFQRLGFESVARSEVFMTMEIPAPAGEGR